MTDTRTPSGRSFPDPAHVAYEPRDDFERTLLQGWVRAAFMHGQVRFATNLRHLWNAYRCGVDAEEIMQRIDAGELER